MYRQAQAVWLQANNDYDAARVIHKREMELSVVKWRKAQKFWLAAETIYRRVAGDIETALPCSPTFANKAVAEECGGSNERMDANSGRVQQPETASRKTEK